MTLMESDMRSLRVTKDRPLSVAFPTVPPRLLRAISLLHQHYNCAVDVTYAHQHEDCDDCMAGRLTHHWKDSGTVDWRHAVCKMVINCKLVGKVWAVLRFNSGAEGQAAQPVDTLPSAISLLRDRSLLANFLAWQPAFRDKLQQRLAKRWG